MHFLSIINHGLVSDQFIHIVTSLLVNKTLSMRKAVKKVYTLV